jgi:hypothetical protein
VHSLKTKVLCTPSTSLAVVARGPRPARGGGYITHRTRTLLISSCTVHTRTGRAARALGRVPPGPALGAGWPSRLGRRHHRPPRAGPREKAVTGACVKDPAHSHISRAERISNPRVTTRASYTLLVLLTEPRNITVPIDRITSSDQGSVDPVHGPPCQDGSPSHVSLREFGEAIEHPLREALHRTMARVRLQD